MSRAERRRAAAAAKSRTGAGGSKSPASDAPGLALRIETAPLPGTPPALATRARAALKALVESSAARGLPFAEIAAHLADGRAARTIWQVEAQEAHAAGRDPARGAACAQGCAFCCILSGEDGGTITRTEAEALHTALAPFAGQPDGRDWHPKACAALDPETRMCRAYAARPALCRAYHSTDAAACEANANGAPTPGARLAGAHLTYLAAHGLARAALKGRTRTDTYALAKVSAAAIAGEPLDRALAAARHPTDALDAERRRTGQAMRATPRG